MAEPAENYEKLLSASLARVTDWLKFSETKNAALLTLASAWTVASANVALRKEGIPSGYEWVLPLSIAFFLTAIMRLIWSFMPRISLPSFLSSSERRYRDTNLIFYGDIAEVDHSAIAGDIEARYMPAAKDTYRDEYLRDIAQQIRIISAITQAKFKAFRTAGWLCFVGAAVLTGPSLRFIAGRLWQWWGL